MKLFWKSELFLRLLGRNGVGKLERFLAYRGFRDELLDRTAGIPLLDFDSANRDVPYR